jgi:hypothetical protein
MAFSFMTTMLGRTTTGEFETVLNMLALGERAGIDRVELDDGRVKMFVHYASSTATGEAFAAQLAAVEAKQKAKESVWPKRIVYDQKRDGSDVYWQVYKCPTKAERASVKTEFTPSIL